MASALRYTGEQTDLDTGLVYLRARWYDSATGRFTTRDPFRGLAGYPQTQQPIGLTLTPLSLFGGGVMFCQANLLAALTASSITSTIRVRWRPIVS